MFGNNPNCETNEAYIAFKSDNDLNKFIKLICNDKLYKISDYDYESYGFEMKYDNPKKVNFLQTDIDKLIKFYLF